MLPRDHGLGSILYAVTYYTALTIYRYVYQADYKYTISTTSTTCDTVAVPADVNNYCVMIWIPDDHDEPTDEELEHIEQTIEQELDSLDLTCQEHLLLASMIVHLRLGVIAGLMGSLSELMDPEMNPDITAEDVTCLRQLIQAVDHGVEQVRDRWDL